MDVGVALPTTVGSAWDEPDLLRSWAEAVDGGPFASLGVGGRIAGDSPEVLAMTGAVAAWTSRVQIRLALTPQLYGTIWLAKSLATLDRLSGGRLEVAMGVGARDEDYRAMVIDTATQTVQQVATRARRMRWVWSGDHFTDTARPVGPPTTRPGGPPLLHWTLGVQAARSGAPWADGITHVVMGPGEPELQEVDEVFRAAREEWEAEARPRPKLVVSLWFALEETSVRGARAQIGVHLREYLDWMPPAFVEDVLPRAGFAGTIAELADLLGRFEGLGADEVHLLPTSTNVADVAAVAEAVDRTRG
jgi:alkanesulfonate monooxygenase SsuD/methylene tetrahydromethanopterin reductase-like flavin-dependent oxidoreductase (luciferase family)